MRIGATDGDFAAAAMSVLRSMRAELGGGSSDGGSGGGGTAVEVVTSAELLGLLCSAWYGQRGGAMEHPEDAAREAADQAEEAKVWSEAAAIEHELVEKVLGWQTDSEIHSRAVD